MCVSIRSNAIDRMGIRGGVEQAGDEGLVLLQLGWVFHASRMGRERRGYRFLD